jgi:hypothetical protein
MDEPIQQPGLSLITALAGAQAYGWSVAQFPGGFTAQSGSRILTATFLASGSFVHASVRSGFRGHEQSLRASEVLGTLAQYGQHGLTPATPTEER